MPEGEATPGPRASRQERIAGLCLAGFAAWVAWASRAYPFGTLAEPGPGFLPFGLALLLLLFGVMLAAGRAGVPSEPGASFADAPHALLLLVVLAGAAIAIEGAGYRLTMAGMLFVLLCGVERRSVMLSVLVAAGVALGSFHLINDLLRVPLPVGRWGW